MSKTLTEIAQQLSTPRRSNKTVTEEKTRIPPRQVEEVKPVPKVQLIYAFNGTGKTRLSRVFKQLIAPKNTNGENGEPGDLSRNKILYYNSFTEDLFYWDNDLQGDTESKLKIQANSFISWVLDEQGKDQYIATLFQRYTNSNITPKFNPDASEVEFLVANSTTGLAEKIKISKGEESNFIWSIFYTLIEQVVEVLNTPESDNRATDKFNQLEYVFIDDPVSSLDENHLIELAVNLAGLIKSSESNLKFIITTHSPLFYNVLHNELNSKVCFLLERFEDGSFALTEKQGDSNKSFSYHLYLKQTLEQAIDDNQIQRYHFTLLRNLYEKTASSLGYPKWSELLPDDKQLYLSRIVNFTSHSTLSNEAAAEPTPQEKATVKLLLDHLKNNYGYWKMENQNG